MAKRPESHRKSTPSGKGRSKRKTESKSNATDKVGSSEKAAEHFAESRDFGIPARKAEPGQQTVIDGRLEDRPLGTPLPPADPDGARTVGVGAPSTGPGSFSGGDLDPDILGVGTGRGIAASPKTRTQGPDIIEAAVDDKAFGPPSKGENELPPGTHGTTGVIKGTVHDRMDRQVRMGESANDDALPHEDVGPTNEAVDRSTGEDVDDREAATGSD